MPLLETKGAASAQGFGLTLQQAAPVYIEDVFSTFLYSGNASSRSINNGIDLAGKGGIVLFKARNSATNWNLYSTTSASPWDWLSTLSTDPIQTGGSNRLQSFNSNGFSLGSDYPNWSGYDFASWTFRKQAKFFDVLTYTGNGGAQTISHSLGSTPGCIIIKKIDSTTFNAGWAVYHRSLTNPSNYYLVLNTTAAQTNYGAPFISSVSSTSFTVDGASGFLGLNGSTYVAYLFAHDAGGFGLTGTDNVISCGSFTTDGSGYIPAVTLGYEPQLLLFKASSTTGNWAIWDTMRGFSQTSDLNLSPNTSAAESDFGSVIEPTATGFQNGDGAGFNPSVTYIYIAIRRGPMKTPTSGTSVFLPYIYTGDGSFSVRTITPPTNSPVDLLIGDQRNISGYPVAWYDRLRGVGKELTSVSTAAESNTVDEGNLGQNNFTVDGYNGWLNSSGNYVAWLFGRAPGFFDVVCFTSTGSSTQAINHNLGVTPELIIEKVRNNTSDWAVQQIPADKYGNLNSSNAMSSWSGTGISAPTATVFSPAGFPSGRTEVAYLFATCPGVSKVGSYTGTGTTKQIDCGFTGGARFVLIKRTDSTGDWYVWDSARGIVSGNDPYLLLNSTAAEVTNTDYVDTYSAGFEISSTAPAAINANGGSFIFLAIA